MAFVAYWPDSSARGLLWATLVLSLAFVPGEANGAERRASAIEIATSARGFTINEMLARRDTGRPKATGKVAAAERTETAIDALNEMPLPHGNGPEPFGFYAMRAPDGQLWTKWRAMEKDLAEEAKAIGACVSDPKNCADGAKRYLLIIEETKKREGRARIETANRLLNRAIRYSGDMQQHGVPDRWTTPLASLAAERGDCEDFAIAKYAVLRAAGVPETEMRLVLVRDTTMAVDHALLAVRQVGEWLVLDNRRNVVVQTSKLAHYTPLFSLSNEGVKVLTGSFAWGEDTSAFAAWTLRNNDWAEIDEWSLRGSDTEPAAGSGLR
jgi:predicted transglutaminase-like cysteine proteinase